MGTPNYTDLTELEMSIRAARDYHIPNLRDWNNLAPVILDATSFKVASQPFKKPASQEQQPGSSAITHTPVTEQEEPIKKKKKKTAEQETPSKKKKPKKQAEQ